MKVLLRYDQIDFEVGISVDMLYGMYCLSLSLPCNDEIAIPIGERCLMIRVAGMQLSLLKTACQDVIFSELAI